jgi:hypothetical protein
LIILNKNNLISYYNKRQVGKNYKNNTKEQSRKSENKMYQKQKDNKSKIKVSKKKREIPSSLH